MVIREAANTNFIVFGFTPPGLEPTISHTQDEHCCLLWEETMDRYTELLGETPVVGKVFRLETLRVSLFQ